MQEDLAISDESAFFQYPEGKVGLTGGLIGVHAQRVPAKTAHEIILSGGKVSAGRAAQTGLINTVVPADALTDRAAEMAAEIASSAPLVLNALKAELARTPCFSSGNSRPIPSPNGANPRRPAPVHRGGPPLSRRDPATGTGGHRRIRHRRLPGDHP